MFVQRSDGKLGFRPAASQDLIQALLERFIQNVPSPAHQEALEAYALVYRITEPLLAHLLERPDVRPLFDWLRALSFTETGGRGIFPHDTVRETLLADLRWRSPERYAMLHARARDYYTARLTQAQGMEQQRLLYDCVFLHRDNQVVKFAFEWQGSPTLFASEAKPGDHAALVAMTLRNEGEEAAELVGRWLAQTCATTWVIRDLARREVGMEPEGFLLLIALHDARPEMRVADPVAQAAWEHLRGSTPLRRGEGAMLLRFWMARETYQDVSPVQSLIAVQTMRHFLTHSNVAYTFFAYADPEAWEPLFTYLEMPWLHDADSVVGGRRVALFGHDWRRMPANEWIALLAAREVAEGEPVPAPVSETVLVLSEPDFAAGVRDALRGFNDAVALRLSPLLRSRLVLQRAGRDASADDRVAALRELLQAAATSLLAAPRTARGSKAVRVTYLEPVPTQEQAADHLDLPFSTYRRHLAEGIAQITRLLWHQEIGNAS